MIDLLKNWLIGAVTWQQEKSLRKKAAEDSFLAEALEGYDAMPDANHEERLAHLRQRLLKKQTPHKKRLLPYFGRAMAASFLLAVSVGVLWWSRGSLEQTPALSDITSNEQFSQQTAKSPVAAIQQETPPLVVEQKVEQIAAPVPDNITVNNPETTQNAATASAKKLDNQGSSTTSVIKKSKIADATYTPAKTSEIKVTDKRTQSEQKSEENAVPPTVVYETAKEEIENRGTTKSNGDAIANAATIVLSETTADQESTEKALEPSIEVEQVKDASSVMMDKVRSAASPSVSIENLPLTIPIGGSDVFNKYIKSNLVYPKAAKLAGIKGVVELEFTLQEDGKVNEVKVLKGLGFGCDEEAIRLLKEGPKWAIPKNQVGIYKIRFD